MPAAAYGRGMPESSAKTPHGGSHTESAPILEKQDPLRALRIRRPFTRMEYSVFYNL